ncbi:low molecular weight phosphotyrosine protein phosphatase [Nocardia sp. NBC_01499]|uniref:low molecular weight protein-tyrosine-phosphatase n=1 Tax=Nocardia sp. NBC_01499 TaxID=2903597 RepID=UPI00386728A1
MSIVSMPPRQRILTVCLGNSCRSPLAAAVLTQRGGAAVDLRSAGLLADKWVGRPADPAMIAIAATHGYDLTAHRACAVTAELLHWADIVLAMDRTNLTALRERCDARALPKLSLYLGDDDVPAPFGHPYTVFEKCLTLIESGADHHLQARADTRRSATENTR